MATRNRFYDRMDDVHVAMGLQTLEFSRDIWADKYRWQDEASLEETARRVADGICVNETDGGAFADEVYDAITAGLWIPAGRILAGAGTPKRVTMMNCYTNGVIEDSMESIMRGNTNAALTMQQGGGIGTDFSTIRPAGAVLERTGTKASGPLPFMDMWHSMCGTIRSAGDRRGAMMATMADTHPDLPAFIEAKHEKGRLTNFNVSVLVSEAFMEAIREDEEWMLYFPKESLERDPSLAEFDFVDEESGTKNYVYSVWRARDLWDLITKNSYEWSEPGVIFIDRINDLNNLWYCEDIRCTNPCGEQPLPPHGTCNLGSVFLSRLVRNPFQTTASFDFGLLETIVQLGTRFLDNVIEATNYPLEAQKEEEFNKRRLGLGFTGLGDVFAQMRMKYGSYESGELASQIMRTICEASYEESVELAIERGSFPLFDAEKFLASNTFAGKILPHDLQERIRTDGIRNGLILSIAPTGTISAVFGNPSSGLEPIFALEQDRSVLQPDNTFKEYRKVPNYAYALFKHIHGERVEAPSYFSTVADLSVDDHLFIQSKIQTYTDASVSKTINCPKEITFENFVQVYTRAYNTGCKGCTTYRPSDVRGSILRVSSDVPEDSRPLQRPLVLKGSTYQIKWPNAKAALYFTINEGLDGIPYEVFFASKDASFTEWTTALSLMITAIFKKGGDLSFVANELKQIQSLNQGAWINQKYYGSLPAHIGYIIETHMAGGEVEHEVQIEHGEVETQKVIRNICPECRAPALIKETGCENCINCGWSSCD